jgi:hypothetical protein
MNTHDSANPAAITAAEASQPRVVPELLISNVLRLISRYGAPADADAGSTTPSAALIEHHLKTLAGLPEMEPILRATCQQLAEQWGMLHEQQQIPRPAPSAFITRLISGPPLQRTI